MSAEDQERAKRGATVDGLPDVSQVLRDFADSDPVKSAMLQRQVITILNDEIMSRGNARVSVAVRTNPRITELPSWTSTLTSRESALRKQYGLALDRNADYFRPAIKECTPNCSKRFMDLQDYYRMDDRLREQVAAKYGFPP